jgi:MHS family proline/betaine transporter-like MFS transporter
MTPPRHRLDALGDERDRTCVPDPRRQLLAAAMGNILEYYDFVVYAFLARAIARAFFPAESDVAGLLATFGAFGAGFLARPVGALLIGPLADRRGRKVALLVSVFGMATATVGIGLLPTFATIGPSAPTLLVALRLLQGLFAGGGWGTGAAFVIESAPAGSRGLYGAVAQACITSSTLLGSTVAAGVNVVFGPEQVDQWAWRIPFLLGAALVPVGLFMRRHVVETPAFRRAFQEAPERVGWSRATILAANAFGFTVVWTVSFYLILSYMPTFTSEYGGLPLTHALWVNSAALVVLIALIPFFGWLSDHVGRKPLLLASCLGFGVLSYPLFRVIADGARLETTLAVQVVLNLFLAAFSGAGPAALAELFPTHARTTLMSLGYSLSTAVFGGFAPFIATWLIANTDSPVSPTLYLGTAAIVSAAVIWRFRETAFEALA